MITAWKLDPIWRMYFEQRKLLRDLRRAQNSAYDRQMEALAADADIILQKVQDDVTKNPGTRH